MTLRQLQVLRKLYNGWTYIPHRRYIGHYQRPSVSELQCIYHPECTKDNEKFQRVGVRTIFALEKDGYAHDGNITDKGRGFVEGMNRGIKTMQHIYRKKP